MPARKNVSISLQEDAEMSLQTSGTLLRKPGRFRLIYWISTCTFKGSAADKYHHQITERFPQQPPLLALGGKKRRVFGLHLWGHITLEMEVASEADSSVQREVGSGKTVPPIARQAPDVSEHF